MARIVLHGLAVSAGIAIGKAFFIRKETALARRRLVPAGRIQMEEARFSKAAEQVALEYESVRDHFAGTSAEQSEIAESHLLICRDPKLTGAALRRIREEHKNAEWALEESVAALVETFERITVPYIRERIQDVRAVADRILRALQGENEIPSGGEKGILLARDLTPADTLNLSPDRLHAFATEEGGRTAHTGILARSLNIPAVVGIAGLSNIKNGELLIVDALRGVLLADPSEGELAEAISRQEMFSAYRKKTAALAAGPAETEDGVRLRVFANVENTDEAELVRASGGEGIGLVRTEFGFISRASEPTGTELYKEYATLVKAMAPLRVVFRTLDAGADKMYRARPGEAEANPALGLRGIRYCLKHQDIFRRQLRAVLRAGLHGNVAVMFPMISGLEELLQAKSILNEARQELEGNNIPFAEDVPVGVMIELPSAVLIADILAREVDFFSIGTNDLIQYSLGADRESRQMSHLHQPLHPAVIRSLKHVTGMAHKAGIPVCVCGEMAADPYCLPLLIGLGVDEISASPPSIPGIKHLIRKSRSQDCRDLLLQAVNAPTTRAVVALARQNVHARYSEELSFHTSLLDAEA